MKRINPDPRTSPFLGIGEGRAKAAAAAAAVAVETAKRETIAVQQLAALAGSKLAAETAAAEASLLQAKAGAETSVINADSGTNLYLIVGGIVIVLMVGLYFILKSKK